VSTTDQGAQAITKLQTDLKSSAAAMETLKADHAKARAPRMPTSPRRTPRSRV
jgi:hypothetical protein